MNNVFFVCGNSYFIKNYIKGLNNAKSFDLEESNFANISHLACCLSIMNESQVVILNKFPSNKKEREFCSDLILNMANNVNQLHFVDLEAKVKYSNSAKPEHDFASIYNKWVILEKDFNDKDSLSNAKWVQDQFKIRNIVIDYDAANLLINNVGGKKEMTVQEIDKLSLLGFNHIRTVDVLENTAKIKKEQILYKFASAMDSGLETALNTLEVFLNNDIHPNVITEMLLKRARWNLFIADSLCHGISMIGIKSRIMTKKTKWASMEDVTESQKSIRKHFSGLDFSKLDKFNSGETIASPFIADIIIKSFNYKYYDFDDSPKENLEKILDIYSQMLNMAGLIRFNWGLHRTYLTHMVKIICS